MSSCAQRPTRKWTNGCRRCTPPSRTSGTSCSTPLTECAPKRHRNSSTSSSITTADDFGIPSFRFVSSRYAPITFRHHRESRTPKVGCNNYRRVFPNFPHRNSAYNSCGHSLAELQNTNTPPLAVLGTMDLVVTPKRSCLLLRPGLA